MAEQKKAKESTVDCPMAQFCRDLENAFGKESKFAAHLRRSRIEFLKGVKALVEDRIDYLEKRAEKKEKGGKIGKIEVEG
jgi:transcription initiation factor IIF auxiliary subunit